MEGFYYHIKESHLAKVRAAMGCEESSSVYPTHMDGVEGWACRRWGGCDGGNEVVSCTGDYGHNYPFFPLHYVDGLQIMWDFMKAHPKKNIWEKWILFKDINVEVNKYNMWKAR